MSKQLNQSVLECVTATNETVPDFDQRSALGMVRSWVDSGEVDVWRPDKSKDMIEYLRRDQLAKDIVAILVGEDRVGQLAALAFARKAVNAPYIDATMQGYRAARLKAGIVGSDKKNLKLAL